MAILKFRNVPHGAQLACTPKNGEMTRRALDRTWRAGPVADSAEQLLALLNSGR